jgi:hypothetical protein
MMDVSDDSVVVGGGEKLLYAEASTRSTQPKCATLKKFAGSPEPQGLYIIRRRVPSLLLLTQRAFAEA